VMTSGQRACDGVLQVLIQWCVHILMMVVTSLLQQTLQPHPQRLLWPQHGALRSKLPSLQE